MVVVKVKVVSIPHLRWLLRYFTRIKGCCVFWTERRTYRNDLCIWTFDR